MRELFLEAAEHSRCSPTKIRRHELALDMALALYLKNRSDADVLRVGLSDSSPMAGYDWLWHHQVEIARSAAWNTYQAVSTLQALAATATP